jgi:aminoglycoside 6'-N-acetyltransferase I
VALDGEVVVGFASGVTDLHPDKPLALWIHEVAMASTHREQGLGKRVMQALLEVGHSLGCCEAWVLTDRSNAAANRLYQSAGGALDPGETVMYSFAPVK